MKFTTWVSSLFTRTYTNVLLLIWLLVGIFGFFAGAFYYAGIGEVNIPLSGAVAGGLLAIGHDMGKRSLPFAGKLSPLNFNAIGAFLGSFAVLAVGVQFGLTPLLESVSGNVFAMGGAIVLSLFNGIFGLAVGSISAFATRDTDQNPLVTNEEPIAQES